MEGSENTVRLEYFKRVLLDGLELRHVPKRLKRDRDIVLAAVTSRPSALQFAADECKRDRDIVLAAVRSYGQALEYAADECKRDREIVLEALRCADFEEESPLEFAADECKRDREIVLAAVKQNVYALEYAAEDLLLDSTFIHEVSASGMKQGFYALKISMLSGRCVCHVTRGISDFEDVQFIVQCCCNRLGIERRGTETLLHGMDVIPARAIVCEWPGIRLGEVCEYQLVVGAQ
eukprot:3920762-Amphidinium_carterae.1